MTQRSDPGGFARAFVRWTLRYGRLLWAVAVVLAIPATLRTTQLYMHLRSDVEELLPQQAPSVAAIEKLRSRMPGLQYLGVVVNMGSPANAPAAERFLDDLAARIRAYPVNLASAVYTGSGAERAFLQDHAPLYASLDDLRAIETRIVTRRDYEVARETGALLEDGTPPPLDFSDLERKYRERLPRGRRGDGGEAGRYTSVALETAVLFVEVGGISTSAGTGRKVLDRVKADVRALAPERYAPGMRVGYAGDVAISVEELSALISDLSTSSVVVIVAVVLAIAFYYGWLGSVVALVAPLLLATVYAFAVASLPPFGVTELNSNTGFLGSILLGNGINFGIVLLARYVEERRAGRAMEDSLGVAVSGTRRGTQTAAAAAAVSYGALAITQFRGFRQFGYIGGLGMIFAWATTFLLMPSLLAALDRSPGTALRPRAGVGVARWTAWLAGLVTRHHVVVGMLGLALIGASVWEVSTFTVDRNLEYELSRLRRADTWSTGEGYWGRRMDAVLGETLTPTVILAEDPTRARAIAKRLEDQASRPPLSEMIQTVRTIDDVLPRDQEAKLEVVRAIREDLTPKVRSLVPSEMREALDRFLGADDLRPIGLTDLPGRFTTPIVERDGTLGRTVLVYPRRGLWDRPGIEAFTRALREAAAGAGEAPAAVAGSVPLCHDILSSIQQDGPLASAAAFLGVALVVAVLLRRSASTAYVLGALFVGVLWLAASAMALGVKINFANFIAFPITFGIGVDYSVNVMSRFTADGGRSVHDAVVTTGSAVALCSVTTIIGYSSLLLAENRALFLFGLLAVLGEVTCLCTALVVLPAFVEWGARLRGGARAERSSA